jgi:hypothetical protein
MNTAEQIILLILAGALALFLIFAIVAIVMVIKLVKTLREIALKADRIVDSAETVTELFRKASGPMTVLHFVRGVADAVTKHKESRK